MAENGMSEMMYEFKGEDHLRYLIGDIRDAGRLSFAMEDIDIVVHLAAMKHVYACEYNPFEAIKTNVDGLQNVIEAARERNVKIMIYASTDKAAHPLSVLGITKLLGEKIVASANYYKGKRDIKLASVRFGNVAGSNGSVIPLFKKQIAKGGTLTVTDKEMTRFMIVMDEAVDLILSAIKLLKGGETFVWKMRTFRVIDLADVMINRYSNGKKIEKIIVGKVEGEKIHEEIITKEELPHTIELDDLYVVFPLIDYRKIASKYVDVITPKDPVIASNKGSRISKEEIAEMLENIDG